MVGKILENKSQTYGFNAQTEEYVDMIEAGIVDPAKVVRTALQDAASVAGLLITTEAMVAEVPKDKPAMPMGGGGGGGMGGDGFLDPLTLCKAGEGAAFGPPFFVSMPGIERFVLKIFRFVAT